MQTIQQATPELSEQLYYTAPDNEHFNELKDAAIEIWSGYDDTYEYASGKIEVLENLKNRGDNFMFMVAMFDINNQYKLADMLSEETAYQVHIRLKAGGTQDEYNPFYNGNN